MEKGENFDCRCSITLQKFSRGLQTHIGRVNRNGVLRAVSLFPVLSFIYRFLADLVSCPGDFDQGDRIDGRQVAYPCHGHFLALREETGRITHAARDIHHLMNSYLANEHNANLSSFYCLTLPYIAYLFFAILGVGPPR